MPGYFDLWTVFFSFIIASLAGFVAFESIEHTRYTRRKELWTAISGAMLGLGIWSMHFVGMLAWQPPFPLYYSLDRTLLSVFAAVASSWLAMRISIRTDKQAPRRHHLLGAVLVATGICGMHYIGMSALHFTQPVMWSPAWLVASIFIAFVASLGALELLGQSGNADFSARRQVVASLVIGLAICGMHYSGMQAMMLHPGARCIPTSWSFSGVVLARIGVGNALIFTIALLIASYRDKVILLRRTAEARFQAQEASRSAERLGAAGRIAASIAHEINNPLEAVTNLLYLAENGNVGEAEREYLVAAQTELRRVAEITTHTLKFYRQQGAAAPVDIRELFESALIVFAKRIAQSGIHVAKLWEADLPRVTCREGEIRQVFANLVGNAIDAMPQGGTLTIVLHGAPQSVSIDVRDTGSGIPEEVREKILNPFFTTKGVRGTGLGLSICAEIIERHHGTMTIQSDTTPGRSGSTFTIVLPLNAA